MGLVFKLVLEDLQLFHLNFVPFVVAVKRLSIHLGKGWLVFVPLKLAKKECIIYGI